MATIITRFAQKNHIADTTSSAPQNRSNNSEPRKSRLRYSSSLVRKTGIECSIAPSGLAAARVRHTGGRRGGRGQRGGAASPGRTRAGPAQAREATGGGLQARHGPAGDTPHENETRLQQTLQVKMHKCCCGCITGSGGWRASRESTPAAPRPAPGRPRTAIGGRSCLAMTSRGNPG